MLSLGRGVLVVVRLRAPAAGGGPRAADPDGVGHGHAEGQPRQRALPPAYQADYRPSGAKLKVRG